MIDHCELCGSYAPLNRLGGRYLCKTCLRQYNGGLRTLRLIARA